VVRAAVAAASAAFLVAAATIAGTASAQEPQPIDPKGSYAVPMSGEELQAFVSLATQCDARAPFACAEFLVFIRRKLLSAEKREEKK